MTSQVRPRRSGKEARSASFQPPPEYGDPKGRPETLSNGPPLPPRAPAEPELPGEMMDNLAVIRETLYSALADVIVENPSVLALMSRGPEWASRAFFASTSLAILTSASSLARYSGLELTSSIFQSRPHTCRPTGRPGRTLRALDSKNDRAARDASLLAWVPRQIARSLGCCKGHGG